MRGLKVTQFALQGETFVSPILFALDSMEPFGEYTVHASREPWAYDAGDRLLHRFKRGAFRSITVTKKDNTTHQFRSIRRI